MFVGGTAKALVQGYMAWDSQPDSEEDKLGEPLWLGRFRARAPR